jgi:signal peptidase I
MQASDEIHDSKTTGENASGGGRRGFFETRYWLRDLILSLLLAFIFVIFLYQPVQVEGTSMMPRLANHERIFINKYIYRFRPIARGDIVVFRFPLDPSKSYIKRVVGLPGETVSFQDGHAHIDGRVLSEPYVPASFLDHRTYQPVKLGRDDYFVLGDHRDSSNDSREWGPVSRDLIYGKAVFVYWPFNQFGLLH